MRMSDWSSDGCSSDLGACVPLPLLRHAQDALPHARARAGRLSRRLWDDGRAVRGADADPDRENGADSSGAGGAVVLEPRGRLRLPGRRGLHRTRSEEHTSELQSLIRISYAVFCLKKKKQKKQI